MADLTANFYPDKRPHADTRTASYRCASNGVFFMNQLVALSGGLLVKYGGTGKPAGLALEERAAGGKAYNPKDAELNDRIIVDVSGPKVLIQVDGGLGAPTAGQYVTVGTDNLDDAASADASGANDIGVVSSVEENVSANIHYCWVQLYASP